MDAHTEWTEVVVGNVRGKVLSHKTVKTGAHALREIVQSVRGPATIVNEGMVQAIPAVRPYFVVRLRA